MMSDRNVIYVGSGKSPMEYVMFILSGFHGRKLDEVVLKARGRAISIAVDAAEITRTRYLPDLKHSVTIGTDQVKGEDGKPRNVSSMEIVLKRSQEESNDEKENLNTEDSV